MGLPCVCGFEEMAIDPRAKTATIGTTVLNEGDWLTIDGTTGPSIADALIALDLAASAPTDVGTLIVHEPVTWRTGARPGPPRTERTTARQHRPASPSCTGP